MISKLAHVDPSAKIADDVKIHAFAYIDKDVEIGPGCEIMPYASIIRGTRMGRNNRVFQGAVVGADPQDFRWKGGFTYCYIGDDNTIREQVIINRGIDHEGGTRIGDKLAGGVHVDECCILSNAVILNEGIHVGKWVFVKGGTRVSNNIPPFIIMAHNPAVYYGVNAMLMGRKDHFSPAEIEDAAKAYRHIYQTQTSLFNAMRRIENDVEPGRVRDEILGFLQANNLRIAGIPSYDED